MRHQLTDKFTGLGGAIRNEIRLATDSYQARKLKFYRRLTGVLSVAVIMLTAWKILG